MFRFEQTREATYDVTGWNVESRSRFVIPSHKFKHNYYNRVKVDGTVYDAGHDFMWGKANEGPEKMKKIGFACSQNKIWAIGMTENKLVFKRKLQGQDEQLIPLLLIPLIPLILPTHQSPRPDLKATGTYGREAWDTRVRQIGKKNN